MSSEKTQRKPLLKMFRDLPPKVKWLIYISSLTSIGIGYFIVVISAYLPEIGISPTYVGVIFGVNAVSFIVFSIPLGMLADRRGRKNIMILGSLGIPPMLFVYGMTTNIDYLIAVGLLGGITEAAFLASWNAMIADMTDTKTRPAAFALSFILGNITFGFGFAIPFVFPAIEDATGWSSHMVHSGAFIVFGLIALLGSFLLWLLLRDYEEKLHEPTKLERGESIRTVLKFSGINSIIGLGAGFIIPLVPTWLYLKFAVPDSYSGPLLAVANIIMGLAAFASAPIAKRYGDVRAIVMTQASSTVFMFSLAFAMNAPLAAGLYLIRAGLMNMAIPVADSYLMGIISEKERGLASAINGIVWRLPNSASTIVGGVLLARGIYDLPFFLATALYITGITLFYIVFKDVKARK